MHISLILCSPNECTDASFRLVTHINMASIIRQGFWPGVWLQFILLILKAVRWQPHWRITSTDRSSAGRVYILRCRQSPTTDVKSTDPIHFLCRAPDRATQCMMDSARRVDGLATVCKFALLQFSLSFMIIRSVKYNAAGSWNSDQTRKCWSNTTQSSVTALKTHTMKTYSWMIKPERPGKLYFACWGLILSLA